MPRRSRGIAPSMASMAGAYLGGVSRLPYQNPTGILTCPCRWTELVPIRRADDGASSEPSAVAGWGRRVLISPAIRMCHRRGGIIIARLVVIQVSSAVSVHIHVCSLRHLPVKLDSSVITVLLQILGENDTETNTDTDTDTDMETDTGQGVLISGTFLQFPRG